MGGSRKTSNEIAGASLGAREVQQYGTEYSRQRANTPGPLIPGSPHRSSNCIIVVAGPESCVARFRINPTPDGTGDVSGCQAQPGRPRDLRAVGVSIRISAQIVTGHMQNRG